MISGQPVLCLIFYYEACFASLWLDDKFHVVDVYPTVEAA